jgi:hypothetical protein
VLLASRILNRRGREMRPRLRELLGLLAFVFLSCGVLAQDAQQAERTRVGEYETR